MEGRPSAAHPPALAVRDAVRRALAEDLGPLGDLTPALLPTDVQASALVVAREDGVLEGRDCAEETFAQLDAAVAIDWDAYDGDPLVAGKGFGRVEGPLASVLTAERTSLNFLCHLSGIATFTRRFVDAAGDGATVWDTRKTTPGLRALEKAAVRAGGGANHRGNLSDWVLLKDNHLAVLGITEAVRHARERWPARTVHVECDTHDQLVEALGAGVDAVLLDNMATEELARCVATVADASSASGAPVLVEASGGITLETVRGVAATGVGFVSTGAITNSAPVLDIGLDITHDVRSAGTG
ncbi:carboxylating nicotinate-nucleotide diphosphorylase [soil metagenome]